MHYKVLLTTSGTGSRLKELTKITNKCLIPISGHPMIDYILRSYPKEIPIVVTLGYFGDQVKKILIKYYPERCFEFAEVDLYEGMGSSLGYSMLQSKKFLHCPFIFHACDTIVVDAIPIPDRNWAAGYIPDSNMDAVSYRTHKTMGKQLIRLNDKGINDFNAIHIGITGIYDHEKFWSTLEALYRKNPNDSTLSDVHVIDRMIGEGGSFESIPFSTWLDTGNLEALHHTEQFLMQSNNTHS